MTALTSPEFNKQAFICPLCGAYARQNWRALHWLLPPQNQFSGVPSLLVAVCDHCGSFSIWLNSKMVYPSGVTTAPSPNPDLPEEIKLDYQKAVSVYNGSPRSSAALLRLAIQKICIHLGFPGKNLNDDIGELVKQGLPVRIQQSLDIVRVIGNEQVHPGTLDVRDNPEMALMLFELVNIIVEDRISSPKRVADLYAKLPPEKREQIEKRDTKPKP